MIRYSFIILLITLSNVACKKKEIDPSLVMPPYSETGSGTFACKVDGEVFNPAYAPDHDYLGGGGVPASGAWLYSVWNNRLNFGGGGLYGENKQTVRQISIELNKVYDTGVYYILEEGNKNIAHYQNGEGYYFTGGKYGGEVHIKRFDTTARIVSGTFWFDGEYNGTIKHITEGVFDVKITGIIRK